MGNWWFIGIYIDIYHLIGGLEYIFLFPFSWEESCQLTFILFRGVDTTNQNTCVAQFMGISMNQLQESGNNCSEGSIVMGIARSAGWFMKNPKDKWMISGYLTLETS